MDSRLFDELCLDWNFQNKSSSPRKWVFFCLMQLIIIQNIFHAVAGKLLQFYTNMSL